MTHIAASRLLVLCSGALAALSGCVSVGNREIRADDPKTMVSIESFQLSANTVTVRGPAGANALIDASGNRTDEVTLQPSESFRATGRFNGSERWILRDVDEQEATFDVRGHYYSCVEPGATARTLHNRLSFWRVTVRRPTATEVGTQAVWPHWFETGSGKATDFQAGTKVKD